MFKNLNEVELDSNPNLSDFQEHALLLSVLGELFSKDILRWTIKNKKDFDRLQKARGWMKGQGKSIPGRGRMEGEQP